MVRTESLARAKSLGRPEIAYVARFTAADGAGEEFKVTWSDIARDTLWLQQRFTSWGMGRGKQVLLSTSGHEGAWFLPVINALKRRVDHRRYNGAALLGLRGLVFKSHGSADELAFEHALVRAYDAARNNLLDRVQTRIAHARPLLEGAAGDAQVEPATN